MIQNINSKEEFDNILKETNGIIIADFFATRCGPCRMLGPIMDELSEEYTEIKFIKIDVDEVPELATEYKIGSIPSIFIGYNHKIQEKFIGANSKEFYEEKIKNILSEEKK